jgi:hypothetical protein
MNSGYRALAGIALLSVGLTACAFEAATPEDSAELARSTDALSVPSNGIGRPIPPAPGKPTKWVVLLCNFQDDLSQPLGLDFYRDLFTSQGRGKGGFVDYLDTVSYHSVDFGVSEVSGWHTIQQARAANIGSIADRGARAERCMAAADDSVDFTKYVGVVAFFSYEVDWGAAGGATGTYDGATNGWPLVVLTPGSSNLSIVAQEVIHGLGLGPHSRDVARSNCGGAPGDYCDPWDVMSASNVYDYGGAFGSFGEAKCTSPSYAAYCGSGPSLNVHFREDFGWLPASRIYTWGTTPGVGGWASENIQLAGVDSPESPGFLELKIPLESGKYYTLELRIKKGWDAGVPWSSVLIHEIHTDEITYLLNDLPYGLQAGESYADALHNVRISVLSINPEQDTAVVNVRLNQVSAPPNPCRGKPCRPPPGTDELGRL